MTLIKSQIPPKVVPTILVLTCMGLAWFIISGDPYRNFWYSVWTSSTKKSPLMPNRRLRLSSPNKNFLAIEVFSEFKYLASFPFLPPGKDDQHTERLLRLEATAAGMRDFLNPTDCKLAPKLYCILDNPHGFASGIHDVLWCFVAALQMNRTMVLNSTMWHYTPGTLGWSNILQPLTRTSCNVTDSRNIMNDYPGGDFGPQSRSKIIDMPSFIIKALAANHGDPYSWLYGQIIGYILRLQNSTRQRIEEFKKSRYKHPIVAMHIRRTDKVFEGSRHDVNEYMQYAEHFYSKLELTDAAVQRRVFVATDEPSVVEEIQTMFPKYIVISNAPSAEQACDMIARNTSAALSNIVVDIHLLADADKLVCAHSSGFCRLAYELMQARHSEVGLDATRKAVSVDVEYYYAFVPFPPRRTLYRNERVFDNELQWLAPGVLVERDDDWAPGLEAMQRHPDGFQVGGFMGSAGNSSRIVFPRFKTAQTYREARYQALDGSSTNA
ncbi:alpha-(1,6)-fucosyltransferase-like [Haemaphysalis longicornis]